MTLGSAHLHHRIAAVDVHLVALPVAAGFADATRKVECVGYTIVRVRTDQGLEGIGLTYHEVGGEATRSLIQYDIAPKIIGRDPMDTEVIWNELFNYLRGVGRKGLTFCAISAVDIALWDLKGKILDLPLYRLLGGGRTKVPVYASGGWTSYDDDELVAEMQDMVGQGYTHIKFKVGVDGAMNPQRDALRVRKVREAVGPEVRLLLDANNCWDAATAVKFANIVREYDIFLFEEPVLADDIPGLARFRRGTDIPLATGEHEYTKFGVRDLILAEAADIVQVDGARAGGFTEMLKIAAMTQAWNLKIAPHAMEHMHLHLVSVAPNALFLERLRLFENVTNAVFIDPPMPVAGHMDIPQEPGLGLRLNMEFITEAASDL
jgi:L-alanine-DL-glutamate epimerase-like enolase superfamily enzyme